MPADNIAVNISILQQLVYLCLIIILRTVRRRGFLCSIKLGLQLNAVILQQYSSIDILCCIGGELHPDLRRRDLVLEDFLELL